jgi:drug/metabolite transporter, DME family
VSSTGPSIARVVAAGVLLGTTGTASALAPAGATPAAIGVLRLGTGALVLLAVMPVLGASWSRLPVLWRRPTVWVMAITTGVYQPLFFTAVAQTGVALGTLVAIGTAPIFTGIFGWVVLRHRPTPAWLVATGVAIVGLALRSWGQVDAIDAVGLLFAAVAGACWGGYMVAAKIELDRGTTALELPAASYAIGTLLILPLLLAQPVGWVASPNGLALVLYLGVVTVAIANVLQIRGLHGLPPGPVSTLMLVDPLTATLLGVFVLGESLTPVAAVGLVLVLAGLVMQGRAVAKAEPADLEPVPVL